MGGAYQKARAGKRADFIKGLLAVAGFAYAGAVPKAMRYPRRGFERADRAGESIDSSPGESSAEAEAVEAESVAACRVDNEGVRHRMNAEGCPLTDRRTMQCSRNCSNWPERPGL